jgi:hypothetical protein
MQTKRIDPPQKLSHEWGGPKSLSKGELAAFRETGADALIYWYVRGANEGSGNALFRKDGKWHLYSLGHNSCYGPTEHLKISGPGEDLRDLKKRCSEGYKQEVGDLFSQAKLIPDSPEMGR